MKIKEGWYTDQDSRKQHYYINLVSLCDTLVLSSHPGKKMKDLGHEYRNQIPEKVACKKCWKLKAR